MGQNVSSVIEARKTRKGAQCSNALNGPFQRVVSREEGIAVSPSNGVKSSLSSFIETRLAALHVKQEAETQNPPATLPGLPTEIILAVAHYLPPSGYMSLSYSCRTIRNKMGASIDHVIGDKVPIGRQSGTTLSIESRNIRYLERMDLQCMLDHDRKMSSSKLLSLYYSSFKIPALPKLRKEWRCSGNAGLLWICPHRQFDYKQATRSSGVEDGYPCESSPIFSVARIRNYFLLSMPIMRVPRDLVPSYEEVREALRPLDAPVCPHLRLNEACVGTSWHVHCRRLRRDLAGIDGVYRGCGLSPWLEEPRHEACDFCGTKIYFDFISGYKGPKTLIVTIVRSIEATRGCTDRAWVAQVAQPADFEEYERAWQATHAECLRRFMYRS